MNTPKTDLLASHLGEIADSLYELQREQSVIIEALKMLVEEWQTYFEVPSFDDVENI